jgi:hypothetical protein
VAQLNQSNNKFIRFELQRSPDIGRIIKGKRAAVERGIEKGGQYVERQVRSNLAKADSLYKPLAASTIRNKRSLGYSLNVLEATGEMKGSIRLSFNRRDLRTRLFVVRKRGALDIVKLLNEGTKRMPARPYLYDVTRSAITEARTREIMFEELIKP